MSEVPHVIEPPQHRGERESALGRIVAAWIVCATLAAALVGYAEARAVTAKDDASRTAETAGITATRSAIAAEQRFDARYEAFAVADTLRYRAALAEWRFLTTQPGPARAAAAHRRAALTRLAVDAAPLVPNRIQLLGRNGPYGDLAFPDRATAASRHDFFVLSAKQDAANVEGTAWGKRVAAYAAVLTLLAVALYLLGFSYRLSSRERNAFIFLGIAFSLVGIAWGVKTIASTPTHTPDDAASAYADGETALATATDAGGYQRAVAAFDRALALRPNFALALMDRSTAIFRAGSPQQYATNATLTKPSNLAASTDDMQRALALGLNRPDAVGRLGSNEFRLALDAAPGSKTEHARFEHALEHTNAALRITDEARLYWHGNPSALAALDASDQTYLSNRGVILLALGRRADAARAYVDAVAKMDDPSVSLASDIGDLETLAARRPARRGDVTAMKELLVAHAWPSTPRPNAHPRITGGELDVWPTLVQLSGLRFHGFRFQHENGRRTRHPDGLSIVVYTKGPDRLGWYVQESVTDTIATGRRYQNDTVFNWEKDGYFISERSPVCLPVGRYRTELYVDGKLVRPALTTPSTQRVELPVRPSRDMQLDICAPRSWARSPLSLEGVLEGYRSADGRSGVYALEIPRAPGRTPRDELQALFKRLGLAPRPLTLYDHYFLGLTDGESYDYTLPDGRMVRAGRGTTDDNAEVIVGVVYGPEAQFDDGATLADIFDSFS